MIACVDIVCGILLALVRTRDVGENLRNVGSRTFPHFSQSMLTPMIFIYASLMYFYASNYFKHVNVFSTFECFIIHWRFIFVYYYYCYVRYVLDIGQRASELMSLV